MAKTKGSSKANGITFLFFLILCIILLIVLGSRKNLSGKDFSVHNDGNMGYSAIYTTLEKLGFDVKVGYTAIPQTSSSVCEMLVTDEYTYEEKCIKWVEDGGTLIFIDYEADGEGEVTVDKVGKGIVIYVDNAETLTNGWLMEDSQAAYDLYTALEEYVDVDTIIFNEYYLYDLDEDGTTVEQLNLWQVMPLPLRMIIIQLIICVVFFFIYAGKRFGKAENLVSETERMENEYIYSVAAIYKKAKAWDLVLESFYKALEDNLRKLTSKEGDLLHIWKEEGLADEVCMQRVVQEMNLMKAQMAERKLKKDEVVPILEQIEHLMKIIDKRREEYWKR